MKRFYDEKLWIKVLVVLILASALMVVNVKQQNRIAFIEAERLQHERAELQAEWRRLQVEINTLAMPAQVEQLAEDLGMVYATQEILIIVP